MSFSFLQGGVAATFAKKGFDGCRLCVQLAGKCRPAAAIIKLLEDKMNADSDIEAKWECGSSCLSKGLGQVLFVGIAHAFAKFLLKRSLIFSTKALNEHEQMLRMRGRQKSYACAVTTRYAVALYESATARNMLGVISDVSFKRRRR